MYLANLDATTRLRMIAEINTDIDGNVLYISPRLSERGRQDYPQLLLDAAEHGDPASLAAELRVSDRLNSTETTTRKGKTYPKQVPFDAPETLADGEFNRFYARGLCVRAIEANIKYVVVYRAKDVTNPRPESEAKVGQSIDATMLLADLRTNIGIEPALGIPPGPNSGLSVRLPT